MWLKIQGMKMVPLQTNGAPTNPTERKARIFGLQKEKLGKIKFSLREKDNCEYQKKESYFWLKSI